MVIRAQANGGVRHHRAAGVRAVRGVAAALLALVALAGCTNAEPNVAVYVDDTKITDAQVDSAVKGVSATLSEGQQVSAPAVVNALIQGAIAEQLAAENNIVITDSDRDTLLAGSTLANLLVVPAAKVVAYDVADNQIVATKLGSQAFLTALESRQVTLNPRYGVLDQKQKLIVSEESGSLANPASAPTPQMPQ